MAVAIPDPFLNPNIAPGCGKSPLILLVQQECQRTFAMFTRLAFVGLSSSGLQLKE